MKTSGINHHHSAKCPLCGNAILVAVGIPEISKEAFPFIRENYQVLKCRSCDYYFVYPQISLKPEEWVKLYGSEYFGTMTKWWSKKRETDRIQRLNWIQKLASGKIRNFLDIGCGEGYVLLEALKRGWTVQGQDVSDNRIDPAKSESIIFHKGTIFETPFPDGYFDCIYLDSVLEHIIDSFSFVKEVGRILRPGGVIYIGVPNENSLFNDLRRIIFNLIGKGKYSVRINPFKAPYHVIGFSENSLGVLLKNANFEISQLRVFGGEYEWRKFTFLSRGFMLHFVFLPVHLMGRLLGKGNYIEVIARRPTTTQ